MTATESLPPIAQAELDELLRLHAAWLDTRNGQPTDLSHRNFSGCDLQQRDLSYAILHHANFSGASLNEAVLRKCDLSYAKFVDAKLQYADLSRSDCGHVDFTKANLEKASLRRCNLTSAQFVNANLAWAILRRSDLSWAHLESATLMRADLSKALLRTQSESIPRRQLRDRALSRWRTKFAFILDENNCIGTKFPQKSADPWSQLRRTYTGTRFVVLLLLTLLAFAPLIVAAVFWRGLSVLEHTGIVNQLVDAQEQAAQQSQLAEDDGSASSDPASKNTKTHDQHRRVILPKLKSYNVGLLLIGWYRGLIQFGLNSCLLLYAVLRGYLTYSISPLRDEEDRSGMSPSKQDTMWWWRIHWATAWLKPISLAVLAGRVGETVFSTVLLPV